MSPASLEDRFWAKVEKTESCWEWTGAKVSAGYGCFRINGRRPDGRTVTSHRLAWELINGPILNGLHLDHICHTKACVRPDHMRLVTHKQNHEHLTGAHVDSKSGVRGVYWSKATNKWAAKVVHYKPHYLGVFEDIKDAEAAAIAKRNELFTHNNLDRTS